MKKLLLAVLLLSLNSAHAAEVYKCTDAEGHLTFSQQPCAADTNAEVIEVDSKTADIEFSVEGDFSKVEADNTARANARQRDKNIAIHQRNITLLRHERDMKIEQLREAQRNARNNTAGATYHNSLATEIQTVTQDYRSRIEAEQTALNRLRVQH